MPVDDFPAKEHIRRLVHHLARLAPAGEHVVLLQGEHVLSRHDTDRELPFHQEANFHYASGCLVPSSTLIIRFTSGETPFPEFDVKLYIPEQDAESSMWSVPPPDLVEAEQMFDFDAGQLGFTGKDDEAWLTSLLAKPGDKVVHVLSTDTEGGYPTPSPWISQKLQTLPLNTSLTATHLQKAFHHARLIKTAQEITYIREACRITSGAHEIVMRELGRYAARREAKGAEVAKRDGKEGLGEWEIESEGDAEAVFVAACRRAGAGQAYLPICASGSRASTLHYVCNDKIFPTSRHPAGSSPTFTPTSTTSTTSGRGCCGNVPAESFDDLRRGTFLPQVLLIDAGCEYRGGYASDITRTIPVGNGGKYTEEGRTVYAIVLKMQKAAEAICKAGAHWDDLHLLCHKVLCEDFIALGIFKGTIDQMLESGLSQAFFPHGLGHSLGLDVHDSLQLLRTEHLDIPASSHRYPHFFKYLRIRRTLEANMVLTIEPGCYFAPLLMDSVGALTSDLVDREVLERYIPVGGVRIEDVVVVREDGCDNLTTVPREVEQIEAICSGRA